MTGVTLHSQPVVFDVSVTALCTNLSAYHFITVHLQPLRYHRILSILMKASKNLSFSLVHSVAIIKRTSLSSGPFVSK